MSQHAHAIVCCQDLYADHPVGAANLCSHNLRLSAQQTDTVAAAGRAILTLLAIAVYLLVTSPAPSHPPHPPTQNPLLLTHSISADSAHHAGQCLKVSVITPHRRSLSLPSNLGSHSPAATACSRQKQAKQDRQCRRQQK